MYVSDYGYSASPENWNTNIGYLYTDTNRNNNWMFMGLDEPTITRYSSNSTITIRFDGKVDSGSVSGTFFVKPVIYLNSAVIITGGSGTQTDPYRIA